MSARFRVTVRGLGVELRGYVDELGDEDQPGLVALSEAMKPFGLVVASPMDRTGDAWEGQPTPEKSYGMIADKLNSASDAPEFVHEMAQIHYGQALVIRGERERADRADALVAQMSPAYGAWVTRNTPHVRRRILSTLLNAPESGDAIHVAEAERIADALLANFNISPIAVAGDADD